MNNRKVFILRYDTEVLKQKDAVIIYFKKISGTETFYLINIFQISLANAVEKTKESRYYRNIIQ